MCLRPIETKFKKERKGVVQKLKADKIRFGSFGIQALDMGILTAEHIEITRQIISKRIKNCGKLWIRVFPKIPITRKSVAVRMGRGKGNVSAWIAKISRGTILYEIEGINHTQAEEILKQISIKLPVGVALIEVLR